MSGWDALLDPRGRREGTRTGKSCPLGERAALEALRISRGHENCNPERRFSLPPPTPDFRLEASPQAQRRERMEPSSNHRSRLRFDGVDHVRTPDGSGRVSVRLEWGGSMYEGTAPCLETQQGVLNAASQAALRATLASRSTNESGNGQPHAVGGLELEVVGVKAVRAFDGWVVVARVNGSHGEERYRLLGAAPCEGEADLPGAAVKAVLNASNRVLEQRIAR
jgi:hypothetical protein